MTPSGADLAVWGISALAAAGVLIRPLRTPEAAWAAGGAALLVVLGFVPVGAALAAVGEGTDVYLFLIGMMLLSEAAREEGLFEAVAAFAVNHARGSPRRLLLLVYAAGVAITAVLSNDATAVVLTPAVFAAARRAKTDPMPHLFACALVANAASFLLPISNPANLVLYASRTPPLFPWLESFALPSLAAIAATFFALRWAERARLSGACRETVEAPKITGGGWTALGGLVCTAAVLLAVSAMGWPLGPPTLAMGVLTAAATSLAGRVSPIRLARGVAWPVIVLVAGLFVLVEGLDRTGVVGAMAASLGQASRADPKGAAWASGSALAVASNLVNNLPAGLMASAATIRAHAPRPVVDALLIGVDLGPNLSVTGSLATILWLTAIRREGDAVGFWRFLKVGAVVMPPALILALAARLVPG